MSEISAAARQELVQAVGERYREGTADAKRRILDEFVVLTGYHRKHAIRVLNGCAGTAVPTKRGRLTLYDAAVRLPISLMTRLVATGKAVTLPSARRSSVR